MDALLVAEADVEMGIGAHHLNDVHLAREALALGQEDVLGADSRHHRLGRDVVLPQTLLLLLGNLQPRAAQLQEVRLAPPGGAPRGRSSSAAVPIKPATNRLLGSWKTCRGVPICWT